MKDYSLGANIAPDPSIVPAAVLDAIGKLSQTQLMTLRHKIDMLLDLDINQLNLVEELGLQFRQGKELLASIQNDSATPANQKAQVFNTLKGQLDKIIKQRGLVLSQERLKRYEAAFLKVLEGLDSDTARQTFMDLYGEFLADKGQ